MDDAFTQELVKRYGPRPAHNPQEESMASLVDQFFGSQRCQLTGTERYWLDRRADIIAALEAEGLQIMSDMDRVWLRRINQP